MKTMTLARYTMAAAGFAMLPIFSVAAQVADPHSEQTPEAVAPDVGANVVVRPYLAPSDVVVPASSQSLATDAGVVAHTNYMIKNLRGVAPATIQDLRVPAPAAAPGPAATFAETPASLACLYGMGKAYTGCAPINNSAYNAVGGTGAIAIVIAFHNPTVLTDLNYFSSYFGLPAPKFTLIKATSAIGGNCGRVPVNAGWSLESALDTQWVHAMAPAARIILVEACDNSYAQLMLAEQLASAALLPYNGGQVSNSWSSGEFSTESTDWDGVFRSNWVAGKPISYFFSAGDAGLGAQYPSVSPWVVSVGGTTINRDPSTLAFVSESCWAGSGGGISAYETYSTNFGSGTGPWTNYQYPLFGLTNRTTPDIALDADPASGAYVYYAGNWYIVGGTSLSAPAIAGIVNNSNNRLGIAPSGGGYYTSAENNLLYSQLLTYREYRTNFYDITTGSNGAAAGVGWDACTGVGSPRGRNGK